MLYDELYDYQKDACDHALRRNGSALFLDQGTGKTWVTAALIEKLIAQSTDSSRSTGTANVSVVSGVTTKTHRPGSYLLVVPLANLETTWVRTLARVQGLAVLKTWEDFQDARLTDRHCCLLVHYEALPAIIKRVRAHAWDLIVYDESQRLKARATKQSRTAEKLTWMRGKNPRVINPTCKRVILSGTPVESDAIDLWAQFRFALPGVLPRKWATFERRWCKATGYMGYKLKFKQNLLPAFLKLIEPHIFRVKRDVLDLPPLSIVDVPVPLLGQQARVYRDLERDMATTTVDGEEVTVDLAITQLVRLQQVTGGFVKTDEGRKVVVGQAKIRKLKALVARCELPVVIFCRYRTEVRLIDLALSHLRVAILTGKTKKKRRPSILRRFQRGKYDAIICQVRVGGVGIDLYRACVAIMYSTTHSFIDYDQALARIHRHGQKQACTIFRLIAENTVDEEIYAAVSSKRKVSNRTLRRTSHGQAR